jgi:hypothetical protein
VDDIKMDLGEIDWGAMDWIGLVQDIHRWRAVMKAVLDLRVP